MRSPGPGGEHRPPNRGRAGMGAGMGAGTRNVGRVGGDTARLEFVVRANDLLPTPPIVQAAPRAGRTAPAVARITLWDEIGPGNAPQDVPDNAPHDAPHDAPEDARR